MIRDPGPIHSLGFSVTSRDIPLNAGEQEGDAPNSGFISRALNDHPIMKFLASAALTMGGTYLAAKLTKDGGLRLAKYAQDLSDNGQSTFATSIIRNVVDIRRHLDELQGVQRYVEGVDDVYSKIVFEQEGRLTTGYEGALSERRGYGFLTGEQRRLAGRNFMSEPTETYVFRDELQKRLVRSGRRLPYELPAMYGVQKAVSEPLFGKRENSERKVKWYNPADVIADFTKTSLTNIATMILPFEFAGATVSQATSSLNTLRYSMNDMRRLTPVQKAASRGVKEVSELLAEVGHDFASLTNRFLKTSAQVSGSLSTAGEVFKDRTGFVQNLRSLRFGVESAREAARNAQASRSEIRNVTFKTLFRGFEDPVSGAASRTVFDLIPSFSGMPAAFKAGRDEFKLLGKGYDALENSIAYNRILTSLGGTQTAEDQLRKAMTKIQNQHSSRISSFSKGILVMGKGGPGNADFTRSEFYIGRQTDAYKDLLEQELISRGVARDQASQFVNEMKVYQAVRKNVDATNIATIGKDKIFASGTTSDELTQEWFGEIIKRYQGIAGTEGFTGMQNIPDVLRRSVEASRDKFVTREFQQNLKRKIGEDWNTMYRRDLYSFGEGVISSKKAQFQDFIQPNTFAQQDFLIRKTAQTLGIRLTGSDGLDLSTAQVIGKLNQRGFGTSSDSNYFNDLRAFLIRNKKMTSGILGGRANLFGLQSLTVSESLDSGRFNFSEDQRRVISDLAASRARQDPVASSLAMSKIDGVYKTSTGQILDFTSIKSSFSNLANFFAREFKIPILGFNPVDLFGYRSFDEMARRSPLQYVSSRSVQPFLPKDGPRPDFYIWSKVKGSKGRVFRFDRDSSGEIISTALQGTYRALPTASADLLTRQARLASNREGLTTAEIRGKSSSNFLNRILGEDRALKIQRKFSIDSEQPNSIFSAVGRLVRGRKDINNPAVIARRLQAGIDIDALGANELEDIFRASESLRKGSQGYGTALKLMQKAETDSPQFFQMLGIKASEISTPQEAEAAFRTIEGALSQLKPDLYRRDIDSSLITKSLSRIRQLIDDGNLLSASQLGERSPTITTRLDQLREEIFRFISQTNQAMINPTGNDIFQKLLTSADELVQSGVISSAQRTEAQAAALGTLFNFSAFRTYSESVTAPVNQIAAMKAFQQTKTGIEKIFEPYVEGSIANVSSSVRQRFSPLLGPFRKAFGHAAYSPDTMAIDPLGSGQRTTLVPTFGTVFGRDPFAAITSALGINTYRNPEGFSTGSIPISHGVERLNRYFGSVGLQLDVSDFNGPLDLFARGMIMKRVLPLYAAGTVAMTADRTAGGLVNEKDQYGERVYSPLILGMVGRGLVEAQAATSGIAPGGMTYEEKRQQLIEGEVPIRQGRFWPLGNTPFKGGKIMYYRPSWYRKLQGGALFTEDTYGSPLEKMLFYNDISPLRPFDPYRFEREHYYDRPYPVTGEYFSGPFGPLVPIANATVGKIFKPQRLMHEDELKAGLAQYAPAGQFGAYNMSAYANIPGSVGGYSAGGIPQMSPATVSSLGFIPSQAGGASVSGIGATNSMLASRAGSTFTAGNMVRQNISQLNAGYVQSSFGPPKVTGVMNPRVVPSGSPISPESIPFQAGDIGFRTQEMLGIYGFGMASMRESLGFGQGDFEPQRSVLQSASKAYGSTRGFWDLNLGGLGDVPIGYKDGIGNLEFSEIVRRFIPKERSGIDYINPIPNTMGKMYPFLPGPEYFTDFTTGDPFTKVQEGEIRLPGRGYERFNKLYPDQTGRYGLVNQLDILGDVAPYSTQYRKTLSAINKAELSPEQRDRVREIQAQVESTTQRHEFSNYKYRDSTPADLGMNSAAYLMGRVGEYIAHSDTFVTNKLFGKKTALEDWERNNVYGRTFPEWQRPFESYIEPMLNKATQTNPVNAAVSLGIVGGLFGRTIRAGLLGSATGIVAGASASTYGNIKEFVTGERFIPQERKKELALEEYSDILNYVKNVSLSKEAASQGDRQAAAQFASAAGRTMYGMDLSRLANPNKRLEQISLALPKRKREHFIDMINAPEKDRERILSTAGRLERRMYQAAWGMDVEQKPDLVDYFSRHELPNESWEGWDPSVSIDSVKIKMGQSMGLEMSQMGYYPQQIKEANLLNPSYPQFGLGQNRNDVTSRLRRLMLDSGVNGSVTPVYNSFRSTDINISAGVG